MTSSGRTVPHVIAVGSSAGGLSAMLTVFSALPHDLPAPILIVQHLSPQFSSHLAAILTRRSGYSVVEATAGTLILAGIAYTAPPDLHLAIDGDNRVRLHQRADDTYSRPSVSSLFFSVAEVCGRGALAVILSGTGTDGTEGARIVREHGGTVIAQSEETCEHSGMPASVISKGYFDFVVPLTEISQRIVELTAN